MSTPVSREYSWGVLQNWRDSHWVNIIFILIFSIFNHIVSEVWWRGWCYVMVMRAENASLAGYLAVLSILDIRESECSFAAAAVRWLARHGDRPKGCQQQSVERPPRPGHSDQEEQEVEYLLKTVTGVCLLIFYSLSFIQFKEFSCDSTNRVFPFHFQLIISSRLKMDWYFRYSSSGDGPDAFFSFNVLIVIESRLVLMMALFQHLSCLPGQISITFKWDMV